MIRAFAAAAMLWSMSATHAAEQGDPTAGVPLGQISFSLSRSGDCMSDGPQYEVEVRGDGTATYTGHTGADVLGTHRYVVPVKGIERLVDLWRTHRLWLSAEKYVAKVSHGQTVVVTVSAGEQTQRIEEFAGSWIGMPWTIEEFQKSIDAAAQTVRWTQLSIEAIDRLTDEGFAFGTPEGGAMLWRAIANVETRDNDASDRAIVRLLQRGAPIDHDGPPDIARFRGRLLEIALYSGRGGTADALIAGGALKTGGKPDRGKVDAAFVAALRGGRYAPVLRVWSAAGARKPSLTYIDTRCEGAQPVPAALNVSMGDDALKIVQWLVTRGATLDGTDDNGRTLLHHAAAAGDVALARYLIERGADVSAPNRAGEPPLAEVDDEDMAMLLIDAGTDLSRLANDAKDFHQKALIGRWWRVIERLQIPR